MGKSLRYFLVTAFLAVFCTSIYAEVTDVNSIAELKSKGRGTYKLNFTENTVIYGAYNDSYSGVYFYIWDGEQGLRINGLYEGKLKELYDAKPVGKAITGSITALYVPNSADGCTLLLNTARDPQCSFDGVLGGDLKVEPKVITVKEIIEAAKKKDFSVDFTYAKIHGYTLYTDNFKYMYDDNGDRIQLDNSANVVNASDFNSIYNNENGTFVGGIYVSRKIEPDESVTISWTAQALTDDWFTSEGKSNTPKVTLDANSDYSLDKDFAIADVTIKGLSFKSNVPSIIDFPFNMTAKQVADKFGEGTKIYRLGGYNNNTTLTDKEALYDLEEYDYSSYGTDAFSVYVIVPTKDVVEGTDLTFNDVALMTYVTPGSSSYTNWTTYDKMYLKGTFSPMELDAKKDLVLDENGNLVAPTGKIKGFTGYFEAPEAIVAAGGVTVKYGDKSTSGIAENVAAKGNSKVKGVYTLAGQRVNGSAKAKGIYIIDGKKVVVK